jgi:hypothetical protein
MAAEQGDVSYMYILQWFDSMGNCSEQHLAHFPTAADVPKDAVRMHVAFPIPDATVDLHLDAVLKASGSALRHYSMAKTLHDMRKAMRTALAGFSADKKL